MLHESRTISIQINRDPATVYRFVADLAHFPGWATSFCQSISQTTDGWLAQTPQGPVAIRLALPNDFGVLDHYVTPASGTELYVPLRVMANGTGSEVVFTLFRLPGISTEDYAADAALVEKDLATLKAIMEE
ncbi:MAG TPA: hypothetical protein VIU41_08485 [Geobacteraceae bacterium]